MSVVVVEGKNDEARIKRIFPQLITVATNGSEINEATLTYIEGLAKKHDIILFLDPDSPGERIRKLVEVRVPSAKHAFILQSQGISPNKRKVGIEHADLKVIKKALENLLTKAKEPSVISTDLLHDLGLSNHPDSALLRHKLSLIYPIGHTNAKTCKKRLEALGIDDAMLINAMKTINEGMDAYESQE